MMTLGAGGRQIAGPSCLARSRPHDLRVLLDLRIVVPPRRVHEPDDPVDLLRSGQPVAVAVEGAVVEPGDDLPVAAVGEESQRLLTLPVVPVDDGDSPIQAFP